MNLQTLLHLPYSKKKEATNSIILWFQMALLVELRCHIVCTCSQHKFEHIMLRPLCHIFNHKTFVTISDEI